MLDTPYEATPDGQWINSDFRRLGEAIAEYDPTMYLSWIPDHRRQPQDTHPFCVVHEPPGREPYVVFYITEEEMKRPDLVLSRIYAGDLRKGDVFGRLKAQKRAAAELTRRQQLDELADRVDFVNAFTRSPRSRYKHGGVVYEK